MLQPKPNLSKSLKINHSNLYDKYDLKAKKQISAPEQLQPNQLERVAQRVCHSEAVRVILEFLSTRKLIRFQLVRKDWYLSKIPQTLERLRLPETKFDKHFESFVYDNHYSSNKAAVSFKMIGGVSWHILIRKTLDHGLIPPNLSVETHEVLTNRPVPGVKWTWTALKKTGKKDGFEIYEHLNGIEFYMIKNGT